MQPESFNVSVPFNVENNFWKCLQFDELTTIMLAFCCCLCYSFRYSFGSINLSVFSLNIIYTIDHRIFAMRDCRFVFLQFFFSSFLKSVQICRIHLYYVLIVLCSIEMVTAEYEPFPPFHIQFFQQSQLCIIHKTQLSRSFSKIFRLIYTFYVTLIICTDLLRFPVSLEWSIVNKYTQYRYFFINTAIVLLAVWRIEFADIFSLLRISGAVATNNELQSKFVAESKR